MLYTKNGELIFKADKLTKREHDLPAFRAIWGIEGQAKELMKQTVDRAVLEISKKLISSS